MSCRRRRDGCLRLIVGMVEHECAAQQICRAQHRFSRRAVRQHTRWGDTQLKVHLARLTELEYLLVHRGGRGQSFEYELLFDGRADGSPADGSPADGDARHASGLIDVETLRAESSGGAQPYDAERAGSCGAQSGPGRPAVGGQSGGGRTDSLAANPSAPNGLPQANGAHPENALLRRAKRTASHIVAP